MPSVSGLRPDAAVSGSIAIAAQRTGADFDYLLAQARIESSFDPAARAPTSSAAGLYQFTRQTWLETLRRHGDEHGLGWASAAIELRGGRAYVADPAMRQTVMNLRFDPAASALMAGELAQDNAVYLQDATGQAPDATALYLAHFLGAGGAARFLSALQTDPAQSAAALFPDAAAANAGIFRSGGRDRSLGEVRDLLAARLGVDGATMVPGQTDFVIAASDDFPGNPAASLPAPAPQQRSMAQVLADTFGGGGAGIGPRAGRQVAAAYSRIAGAGL